MKKLIVLLAIFAVLQVAAIADPVTLDLATIKTFTQIGSSTSAVTSAGTYWELPNPTAIAFGTTFPEVTTPSAEWAAVGSMGLSLDLTGFSTFSLLVDNTNENPWYFQLFVGNTAGGSFGTFSGVSSILTQIPNGSGAVLSVALGSLANANTVFVQVSDSSIPIGGGDYIAEYHIAPVPEPASMLLLGTGLLGLGLVTRKWNR